jgi:hypothetical protein
MVSVIPPARIVYSKEDPKTIKIGPFDLFIALPTSTPHSLEIQALWTEGLLCKIPVTNVPDGRLTVPVITYTYSDASFLSSRKAVALTVADADGSVCFRQKVGLVSLATYKEGYSTYQKRARVPTTLQPSSATLVPSAVHPTASPHDGEETVEEDGGDTEDPYGSGTSSGDVAQQLQAEFSLMDADIATDTQTAIDDMYAGYYTRSLAEQQLAISRRLRGLSEAHYESVPSALTSRIPVCRCGRAAAVTVSYPATSAADVDVCLVCHYAPRIAQVVDRKRKQQEAFQVKLAMVARDGVRGAEELLASH